VTIVCVSLKGISDNPLNSPISPDILILCWSKILNLTESLSILLFKQGDWWLRKSSKKLSSCPTAIFLPSVLPKNVCVVTQLLSLLSYVQYPKITIGGRLVKGWECLSNQTQTVVFYQRPTLRPKAAVWFNAHISVNSPRSQHTLHRDTDTTMSITSERFIVLVLSLLYVVALFCFSSSGE
jgi:hypothetical protein